jgi:hypothetical protein
LLFAPMLNAFFTLSKKAPALIYVLLQESKAH